MILLPSIDLMNRRVVSLVGGKRGTQQMELPDGLAIFQQWVDQGAEWIHMVDLDAAFGTGSNEDLVRKAIESHGAKVQVGGGVRTEARLRAWLKAGAGRVVVGTQGVMDPAWLRRVATTYPDRVVQAVDAQEGRIVARAWTQDTGQDLFEFARRLDGSPLAGLLYTAVHVEGRLQGVDRDRTRKLVEAVKLPVYASGGITTLDDVKYLKDIGCAGAVLGLALYNGRLDFQQAKNLVDGV